MLPLLVALSLGANAGPISVVVSSKRPGADAYAGKLATRVYQQLVREGFSDALDSEKTGKLVKAAGFSDARNCQGGQKCLQKLAVLVGANSVVIGVDVGKVGKQLAVHLEAILAADASTVALSDFSATVDNYGDDSAVPITLFVRQLAQKISAPAVAEKPPEPKPEPRLEPKPEPKEAALVPPPPPPPEVVQPAPGKSHLWAWTFTGATVVAAGVAGTFGFLGLDAKGRYDKAIAKGPTGTLSTTLSRAEIDSLGDSVNSDFTLALASGIAALVFAAAMTWFWLAD